MGMTLGPREKKLELDSEDNFDLYFLDTPSGYKVVLFMKVQFFFDSGSGGKWSDAEKKSFVGTWVAQVGSKWGTASLTTTASGKRIPLEFRFQTQIEGWMWDHWEITVKKLKPGEFSTSWVMDGSTNESQLDSGDVALVSKGEGQQQRATVHEFGHMLGLDDEYTPGSTNEKDYPSVMNRGETIFPRHLKKFKDLADKWVKAHKIP